MDLTQATVLSGAVIAIALIVVTIARQKRFEARDFYSFVVTFIAGSNIPPSLFLCVYGFFPDDPSIQTKLRGFEKYIFLAGLSLFLISLLTLWKLAQEAWRNGAHRIK